MCKMMGTETESISLRIHGYPSSQNGDITNIHTPCTATVCSKGVSSIRLLQVLGARRRPSPTRKTQSSGPPLFPLRQNAVYRTHTNARKTIFGHKLMSGTIFLLQGSSVPVKSVKC